MRQKLQQSAVLSNSKLDSQKNTSRNGVVVSKNSHHKKHSNQHEQRHDELVLATAKPIHQTSQKQVVKLQINNQIPSQTSESETGELEEVEALNDDHILAPELNQMMSQCRQDGRQIDPMAEVGSQTDEQYEETEQPNQTTMLIKSADMQLSQSHKLLHQANSHKMIEVNELYQSKQWNQLESVDDNFTEAEDSKQLSDSMQRP